MGRRGEEGRECAGGSRETGRDVNICKELRGDEKGKSSCISAHHVFYYYGRSDQTFKLKLKFKFKF
jgi:hypothetical protein